MCLVRDLKQSISEFNERLDDLRYRIYALETNVTVTPENLEKLKPSPEPSVSPSEYPTRIEFPLKELPEKPEDLIDGMFSYFRKRKSLGGIISHLTQRYRGNVHDKGIVTITSKATPADYHPWHSPRNAADLTSGHFFFSKPRTDQWICWDFKERRVCPTHYIIRSDTMSTWMIEGSPDGEHWTVIDRKKDTPDLDRFPNIASFAVSKFLECRCIRLTQNTPHPIAGNRMALYAFEIFGTLLELKE
jgi:hypothetical protein